MYAPKHVIFNFFDQFIACETRKSGPKSADPRINDPKSHFSPFFNFESFFMVSYARNWSEIKNDVFRGIHGVQNLLQMSIFV